MRPCKHTQGHLCQPRHGGKDRQRNRESSLCKLTSTDISSPHPAKQTQSTDKHSACISTRLHTPAYTHIRIRNIYIYICTCVSRYMSLFIQCRMLPDDGPCARSGDNHSRGAAEDKARKRNEETAGPREGHERLRTSLCATGQRVTLLPLREKAWLVAPKTYM